MRSQKKGEKLMDYFGWFSYLWNKIQVPFIHSYYFFISANMFPQQHCVSVVEKFLIFSTHCIYTTRQSLVACCMTCDEKISIHKLHTCIFTQYSENYLRGIFASLKICIKNSDFTNSWNISVKASFFHSGYVAFKFKIWNPCLFLFTQTFVFFL